MAAFSIQTPTQHPRKIYPSAKHESGAEVGTGWIVNATSADITGTEQLVATPGSGANLYITKLLINSDAAITVTIGTVDTAGDISAGNRLLGPHSFAANSTFYWEFEHPLKVGANLPILADASGAGNVHVFMEGYTI